MKLIRFKSWLNEASLSYSRLHSEYWNNLLNLIKSKSPISIGKSGTEEVNLADYESTYQDLYNIWDGNEEATPDQINQIKNYNLKANDGKTFKVGNIYKSPSIKGKDVDFNLGDIGEFVLGLAISSRFLNKAKPITLENIQNTFQTLTLEKTKKTALSISGKSKLGSDILETTIIGPSRSIQAFSGFLNDINSIPEKVKRTFNSSIKYVNEMDRIKEIYNQIISSKNPDTLKIISAGTEDQKGTKADLKMFLNGETVNLFSIKTGLSQLGQASGHDWKKQQDFFKTFFNVDISEFEKSWGKSNEEHIVTLKEIYTKKVIPKVTLLTKGDKSSDELTLLKNIGKGIIKYSNDSDKTIDIVKIGTSSEPNYKVLRIDDRIIPLLENIDLIGSGNASGLGVQVHGIYNGKKMLIVTIRSYFSPAAKLVRTIVESGPLLDIISEVK